MVTGSSYVGLLHKARGVEPAYTEMGFDGMGEAQRGTREW